MPTVPAGVPSTLLERRPDVAEAERKMAAANAQIGVAKAGYFPDLTLTGQDQYSSTTFSRLIRNSNRIWAVGPALAETAVRRRPGARTGAGRTRGLRRNGGCYRQTVLSSFQQVEDEIVTLRVLEQEGVDRG